MSDKAVRIVQSYVGVVNKMVWRKGKGARLLRTAIVDSDGCCNVNNN